ncbi:hypothetical protein SHKM778_11340 [Streptomyces sp. KM77-8]|uniref:Uncharacterized protein n=1 Tax=Streptomyces haneummycinicus TaxID=3074435 RepID=A0AAT9HBH8_9ACTN
MRLGDRTGALGGRDCRPPLGSGAVSVVVRRTNGVREEADVPPGTTETRRTSGTGEVVGGRPESEGSITGVPLSDVTARCTAGDCEESTAGDVVDVRPRDVAGTPLSGVPWEPWEPSAERATTGAPEPVARAPPDPPRDASAPEDTRPDVSPPEAPAPEGAEPDAPEREGAGPVIPVPESPEPEDTRPDDPVPEDPDPEDTEPDRPVPEDPDPEDTEPDHPVPEDPEFEVLGRGEPDRTDPHSKTRTPKAPDRIVPYRSPWTRIVRFRGRGCRPRRRPAGRARPVGDRSRRGVLSARGVVSGRTGCGRTGCGRGALCASASGPSPPSTPRGAAVVPRRCRWPVGWPGG